MSRALIVRIAGGMMVTTETIARRIIISFPAAPLKLQSTMQTGTGRK